MNGPDPYEEILEGDLCLRRAPSPRHEEICRRLHERLAGCLADHPVSKLLPARTKVTLSRDNQFRPDAAVLTAATSKLWLAVEVIAAEDHGLDTVTKKALYEQMRVPRLWMVDLRYQNVEVYHSGEYGLALKGILAGRESLSEPLIPAFEYVVDELFG